jgi:hypothetical protein
MSRPSSNDTTSLMGACNTALKLPMYRPRPPFRHRGLALNAQAACCGHGPVSARSGAILGSNDLEARRWRSRRGTRSRRESLRRDEEGAASTRRRGYLWGRHQRYTSGSCFALLASFVASTCRLDLLDQHRLLSESTTQAWVRGITRPSRGTTTTQTRSSGVTTRLQLQLQLRLHRSATSTGMRPKRILRMIGISIPTTTRISVKRATTTRRNNLGPRCR